LTPAADGTEHFLEDDETQVVDPEALKPAASEDRHGDLAAEAITGVKGLSLKREDSDDKKSLSSIHN
jgi:phosphatidate phosphatase LPIN